MPSKAFSPHTDGLSLRRQQELKADAGFDSMYKVCEHATEACDAYVDGQARPLGVQKPEWSLGAVMVAQGGTLLIGTLSGVSTLMEVHFTATSRAAVHTRIYRYSHPCAV
jgi:hypothetical protein